MDGLSVSSLKTDAIFNMDFMLFTIGPTCFTNGMVWFITPSVLEALLINPPQLIPLKADRLLPNLPKSPRPRPALKPVAALFKMGADAMPLAMFGAAIVE